MELSIKRAILLRPDLARVYSGAASPLRMVDRVDDSVYWFRRAKLVEPNSRDVRTSLGLVLIQSNNWQEGWAEYEHREGNFEFCTEITHRGGAIWKGESLAGKSLLLTAEQGFGDTFQFIRFIITNSQWFPSPSSAFIQIIFEFHDHVLFEKFPLFGEHIHFLTILL